MCRMGRVRALQISHISHTNDARGIIEMLFSDRSRLYIAVHSSARALRHTHTQTLVQYVTQATIDVHEATEEKNQPDEKRSDEKYGKYLM